MTRLAAIKSAPTHMYTSTPAIRAPVWAWVGNRNGMCVGGDAAGCAVAYSSVINSTPSASTVTMTVAA